LVGQQRENVEPQLGKAKRGSLIVNDRCVIHYSGFRFLAPFDLAVGGAILLAPAGTVAVLASHCLVFG
jgi:hypothetical protein